MIGNKILGTVLFLLMSVVSIETTVGDKKSANRPRPGPGPGPGPNKRKTVATTGPMKYVNMAKNMYQLYQKMGKNSKNSKGNNEYIGYKFRGSISLNK